MLRISAPYRSQVRAGTSSMQKRSGDRNCGSSFSDEGMGYTDISWRYSTRTYDTRRQWLSTAKTIYTKNDEKPPYLHLQALGEELARKPSSIQTEATVSTARRTLMQHPPREDCATQTNRARKARRTCRQFQHGGRAVSQI
jgi:hypothetical protein